MKISVFIINKPLVRTDAFWWMIIPTILSAENGAFFINPKTITQDIPVAPPSII